MKPISVLQSAVDQAAAQEQSFIKSLSPQERSEKGTFERWSAKDTLAHIAYWRQQMGKKLRQLANPEVDPWGREGDSQNEVVFKTYRDTPWDDVERMLAESIISIKTALGQANLDDLQNPALDPWHSGRAPWKTAIGNGFTHPIIHLVGYLVAHGQKAQALQLQKVANDTLLTLDDDPDWKGLTLYNLACVQALAGEHDQALEGLQEAFKLAPRLIEWSKQDTDLVSLHADPRFLALFE
jgi:tetratricopeptide (TPR) repeat protein